ncbi:putative GNAT family acetyltransferase [Streptomyces sp. V4I23]|uniref:GNAT family N-acetyltransferase n=1 Tax=Streptomyces sp. V4I23 TaxID=3042282 RepID=UPI00277E64FB|nr:GNAT family N-acetyltransferase [Streptomyces sp. V4I23]MDQ1006701.1 putative GNAT family acetyltransferase [Streptomyces sp. V4I23]
MSSISIDISDDRDHGLLVGRLDGEIVGFIQYFVLAEPERALVPVHTVVEPEHAGNGYAGALARELYRTAAREGIAVAPLCPYVVKWQARHPEEAPAVGRELLDAAEAAFAADPARW